MQILYHHRTLGDGAEGIHVSSIVQAFRKLGHDVKVAALIGEQTNLVTQRGRRIKALLGLAPRIVYELLELAYTMAGYRLLKVTASGWKPELLYERYALFNFAGLKFARRQNIPFVLEVNAPLAYERTNYEELVLNRLARHCERVICSKANLVVVVSTPLKEYLVEQGVPGRQIRVLPNGADVELFHPDEAMRKIVRSRLGISDETVVIGFVGILRPWHGIETLCAAMAELRSEKWKVHLVIVGDGPSRQDIERLIQKDGLEKCVTITGRIPHTEIPSYLTAFDIGVSPRATFYASPMKLLEYMATGVVVVAPRMANIQDIVTDGVDGSLFFPEDRADLCAKLSILIENPDLRRRMGGAARENILKSRTWLHNASQVLDWVSQESR